MKILKFALLLSAWTTTTKSQMSLQEYYQQNNLSFNPDRIYFLDSRPEPNNNRSNNVFIEKQSVQNTENYEEKLSTNIGTDDLKNRLPVTTVSAVSSLYDRNIIRNKLSHPPQNNLSDSGPLPGRNNAENPSRQATVGNVSLAMTNFGLNVLKAIDSRATNVVVSPYSIATLLAVVQQGSLGITQQQISAALQLTPIVAAETFKNYKEHIEARELSRNILRTANNIFIADAFNLNPAFRSVAKEYFASDVTPTSFSRPDRAARDINNWVARKTNNKIKDLVPQDAVDPNSQLVLVNAVYFKGLWQTRFKPESTELGLFSLGDGSIKQVPFMRIRRNFRAGVDKNNNAQVIILPFEGEQYHLMVVVPQATTLNGFLSSLTDSVLAGYNQFTLKEVELHIPKFSVRHDSGLNDVLRMMGVTEMFGDNSELSGIGTYRTFSPKVSSAVHSAMLSIDEDGGTGAAATAFSVVALSYDDPSMIFRVNKPFLAIIWDNQFAIPLFMAKIDHP